MRYRRRWTLLVVVVFSIACLGTTTSIPTEAPGLESFLTSESTPECNSVSDVTFKLQKVSDTIMHLNASGLQPGETPYVVYQTLVDGNCCKGGEMDATPVDEQGRFSFELDRLEPPEGQTTATWDVKLIHSRGVECAAITLP